MFLKLLIRRFKRKLFDFFLLAKSILINKKIIFLNKYELYSDYLEHQKNKTTNPKKIEKWIGEEWDLKYQGFLQIFNKNKKYLLGKNKALCLGSRTGQEVKALIDLGIDAKGLDLVPFPPYTFEGDIHNIDVTSNTIDLIFTNIVDHSLYPDKFCSEMARICKPKGIIIIHLQRGIEGDIYSENLIRDPAIIIGLFDHFKLCENRKIKNSFDMMNWEIILEKNKL